MTRAGGIGPLCWPAPQLGECVAAVIQKAGLGIGQAKGTQAGSFDGEPERVIDWQAKRLGCESETIETTFADLDNALKRAHPALLKLRDLGFLAILDCNRRRILKVLTADLAIRRVGLAEVCAAVRAGAEQPNRSEYERLLGGTEIPLANRAQVVDALLAEQIGGRRFAQCWMLRISTGAEPMRWLRQARVWQNVAGLIAAHSVQYLVLLAAWAVLGKLSLAGHLDHSWFVVWALLLIIIVPFRALSAWLQGQFVVGIGRILKRRLLFGALRLEPDEVRHSGIGSFLGQALEAEAVETLALGGGIAGVLAIIEIAVSAFLLGRFALLLCLWIILTAAIAWRFLGSYERWSGARMHVTEGLIEAMIGNRTRLAQQRREDWHEAEDIALDKYFKASRKMDRTAAALVAFIPRGWLLAGLACLAPAVAEGALSQAQLGIKLGGLLLAYAAFKRLTAAFSEIASASVAWQRIAPLFYAASRPENVASSLRPEDVSGRSPNVIEADLLTYSYGKGMPALLKESSLVIQRGERVLLEGSSGGGKSTLASLLAGLRQPDSGGLRLNGRDRRETGDDHWRKQVVAAPQFHENHILTESLAFNLLMGRTWPPAASDLAEAEAICRELGLGDLFERMPAGLMQMVGEGGWQLSHGERSRIYVARAILQNPELMILDESFGALDPENAKSALECTLLHANTLLVIAHP